MQENNFNISREYSDEVDKMRKKRVELSYYKYGPASVNFGEHLVNAINSSKMSVDKYY